MSQGTFCNSGAAPASPGSVLGSHRGGLTLPRRGRYDEWANRTGAEWSGRLDIGISAWNPAAPDGREGAGSPGGGRTMRRGCLGRRKSVESIVQITINGERREMHGPLTVAELLRQLGVEPASVAVEVNKNLVTRSRHAETAVASEIGRAHV